MIDGVSGSGSLELVPVVRRERSFALGGSGLFRSRWCVGAITVQTTKAEGTELHLDISKARVGGRG